MIAASDLFNGIPEALRKPLTDYYVRCAQHYLAGRWESSELNGGKLCEVVYCILEGATSGVFPNQPSKPNDMVGACRGLEQRPQDPARVGDRSLRILIPRVLLGVYEVRNNRGVGHAGGDVDSNKMDATLVYSSANWIMCELVRIFHGVSLNAAQQAVTALVERKVPEIWVVDGVRRVLETTLTSREQTLLLLYAEAGWVGADDLRSWIEYQNVTNYRNKILIPLHKERSIEFDQGKGRAQISPKGATEVETKILPRT